jgi:hypothetical protein
VPGPQVPAGATAAVVDHGAFAAVAIAAEVYWIASQFEVLA